MKKILSLCFCIVCIPDAYADNPVMSLGIEGYASLIGEVLSTDGNEPKAGGYQFEGGLYADLKILCTSDRGRYFHELYFSYGKSSGEFSYSKDRNRYTADTMTVLYKIGGFQSSPGISIDYRGKMSVTPVNDKKFLFAGAGCAVDRYRTGPLAYNSGSPYLVRPIFCFGGGLLYEHLTITVIEFRFDQRFKSQAQRKFNEHLEDHTMGAVGVYSSLGFNF